MGAKAGSKLLAEVAQMVRDQQREREKAAAKPSTPANDSVEELATVNEFAAQHGDYRNGHVVDLTGELGRKQSITKVLINRGGTAVERWRSIFEESEWRAIGHCQALWSRAGGSGSLVMDPLKVVGISGGDGWSQHEALTELSTIKGWFPPAYWGVFEDVCRWDEPAGVAGSKLASNNRSAIDKAQMVVRFTAGIIALRLGL